MKARYEKLLQESPIRDGYTGSGRLAGKVAFITGGDSGIGRAVAVHFAREGADVAIGYHESDDDAAETAGLVEAEGRQALLIKGDVAREAFCNTAIARISKHFGKVDILVNNAGMHKEDKQLEGISKAQLQRTFEVNTFSMFYLTKAALEVLPEKTGVIINTASIVAYRGSDHLLDYAATKGAVVAFTRSLAANLADKGIRVNAVAPGPVWTPLVVEAFSEKDLAKFGKDTPLGRAGLPREIAPAYVFLAGDDATYITGQVIHVNGGEVVNA